MNHFQGPAPFDHVLKVAAELAEKQNNRADEVRRERSAELQRLAAQIDGELDRRKNRKNRVLTWDYFRPTIERMTDEGFSDDLIAKELSNQGFIVDRRTVYRYRVDNGITKEIQVRYSKLEPFHDFIARLKRQSKSDSFIAAEITKKGVLVGRAAIQHYVNTRIKNQNETEEKE